MAWDTIQLIQSQASFFWDHNHLLVYIVIQMYHSSLKWSNSKYTVVNFNKIGFFKCQTEVLHDNYNDS